MRHHDGMRIVAINIENGHTLALDVQQLPRRGDVLDLTEFEVDPAFWYVGQVVHALGTETQQVTIRCLSTAIVGALNVQCLACPHGITRE